MFQRKTPVQIFSLAENELNEQSHYIFWRNPRLSPEMAQTLQGFGGKEHTKESINSGG